MAFDFLGHGESAHINNSNLYTADEVSLIISLSVYTVELLYSGEGIEFY